jgi:hypothetical protein
MLPLLTLVFANFVLVYAEEGLVNVPFNSRHFDGEDGPWPSIPIEAVNSSTQFDIFPTFWNGSIFVKQRDCTDDLPAIESLQSVYRCQDDITFPRFYQDDAADDRRELVAGSWYNTIWSNRTTTLPIGEDYMNFAQSIQLEGSFRPRNVEIGIGEQTFSTSAIVSDNWKYELSNYSRTAPLLTSLLSLPQVARSLTEDGSTSSPFFSYHMGSISPAPVPGSLVFGGHNKNHILGKTTTFNVTAQYGTESKLGVVALHIGVETGFLPLDTLRLTNGSYPQGPYNLDPYAFTETDSQSWYSSMYLEPGEYAFHLYPYHCDALARVLSLTWDPIRNLYKWNHHPDHPIFRSPVYLEFAMAGLKDDEEFNSYIYDPPTQPNIKIKIPLAALQHTFHSTTMNNQSDTLPPTRYFPCASTYHESEAWRGYPRLGRAFFQAAWVGGYLHDGPRMEHWLAQAPGPDGFKDDDEDDLTTERIQTGTPAEPNAWTKSWSSVLPIWTLDADGNTTLADLNAEPERMSRAKKLGIEVGVPIAAVLVVGVLLFFTIKYCVKARRAEKKRRKAIREEDEVARDMERRGLIAEMEREERGREKEAVLEEQRVSSTASSRRGDGGGGEDVIEVLESRYAASSRRRISSGVTENVSLLGDEDLGSVGRAR